MGIANIDVDPNDVTSALFDMYDIRDRTRRLWNHSKDEDNSDITVKDCLDDVIYFLEDLEKQTQGKGKAIAVEFLTKISRLDAEEA